MAREQKKQQILYSRKDKSNKNGNREESDVEDGGEDDMGDYLQTAQSNKERLQIREKYRRLMEHLTKNKHDLINPESDKLNEVLDETNEINKNVRMPREGALDSATILIISNLGRQRADALNTDFVRFEPVEFAEKLIRFFSPTQEQGDVRITSQGWITLGAAVQKYFRRSPTFQFMCGSFDREEKKLKKKELRPKQIDKEGKPTEVKNIDNVKNIDADKNEATTAEVERVLSILQQCYEQNEENPICYFEFVLNPHSFGQTVENIFYSSFLIRDGHARISLDEDGLPLIEPFIGVEGEQPQENKRHHQAVVSINPPDWKELVEIYKITDPLIPTRETRLPKSVLNESTSKTACRNGAASSSSSSSSVKKSKKS